MRIFEQLSQVRTHVKTVVGEGSKQASFSTGFPDPTDWEDHLEGIEAIGLIPGLGATSNWAVLDADKQELTPAVIEKLEKLKQNIPSMYYQKGLRRGYHVHFFLDKAYQRSQFAPIRKTLEAHLGTQFELFPTDKSTPITAPGFGRGAAFVEFLDELFQHRQQLQEIYMALCFCPCDGQMVALPIEDMRNETIYRLLSKTALHPDVVSPMLPLFSELYISGADKPDGYELQNTFRSAVGRRQAMQLDNLDEEGNFLTEDADRRFLSRLVSITRVQGDELSYRVTVNLPGKGELTVDVASAVFLSAAKCRSFFHAKLGYLFDMPESRTEWETFVINAEQSYTIEQDYETTRLGAFHLNLKHELTRVPTVPDREQAEQSRSMLYYDSVEKVAWFPTAVAMGLCGGNGMLNLSIKPGEVSGLLSALEEKGAIKSYENGKGKWYGMECQETEIVLNMGLSETTGELSFESSHQSDWAARYREDDLH